MSEDDLLSRHKTLLLLSQQELEEQLVDLLVHWSIRSGDHPALTIGRLIDMMPWDEDEWAEQLIEFREDLFT